MRTAVLALALAGLVPAQLRAQVFDYHVLLDSTMPAASTALVAAGHRAETPETRPDGQTQRAFSIKLPGDTALPRADLQVVLLGQGDRINRVVVRSNSHGADSASIKAVIPMFVEHLTAAYGRPLSSGEEAGWCWANPRRFIELTLDRSGGEMTLTVGYGPR